MRRSADCQSNFKNCSIFWESTQIERCCFFDSHNLTITTTQAQREKRRHEIDAAIAVIKRRKQPVTKKAIADETGISIQSFYVAGFLRQYVEELENNGVIVKERGSFYSLSAEEEKALRRENAKLKKRKRGAQTEKHRA